MVIACDLPLLDPPTLQYLKDPQECFLWRQPLKVRTTISRSLSLPSGNPKVIPVLLSLLSQGISCPGKALRNMNTTVLPIQHLDAFTNVNTPEEFEKVQQIFSKEFPVAQMPNDFERYSCQLLYPDLMHKPTKTTRGKSIDSWSRWLRLPGSVIFNCVRNRNHRDSRL